MTRTESTLITKALDKFLREGGLNPVLEKALREREQYLTAREGAEMLHVTLKIFRGLKLPRVELSDQTFRYKRSDIQAELDRRIIRPERKGKVLNHDVDAERQMFDEVTSRRQ